MAMSFLVSATLTSLIIPKIILISFRKNLFDTVDERKVHTGAVPRLGGIAFTPAIIITIAMVFGLYALAGGFWSGGASSAMAPRLTLSLSALLLLYLEGITDDLIGVSYKMKFLVQLLCATAIVLSGIWISDLYGLFGLHAIPAYVGMPLSVLVIVYCINAINLIDGIDGLASGLSSIALFFFGCLFFRMEAYVAAVISFATLGTLLPFFRYNVFGQAERRTKIFMGDCGSQTVGLILGMLAVRFCMDECQGDHRIANALAVSFSLLMVPCLDVVRVMAGRIRRGKNPFLPDRTHIHHKFLSLGMSHRTAMIFILMLATFFALLNLSLLDLLNINIVFVLDVLLWCVLHLWINLIIKYKAK